MIALVIVSHSQPLADGLKALARTMSGAPVPIASAGGVAGEPGVFGSDAIRILVAIEDVYTDEGVLVFTDIGSTRLNAETAIDLLEDERRKHVSVCPAPLVEGVLSAVVQAGLGSTLEAVRREAIESMIRIASESGRQEAAVPQDGISRQYRIDLPEGLHARPAARFVEATKQVAGDVVLRNVTRNTGFVNARSLNAVLTSDVASQDNIEVVATSQDAEVLFAALDRLACEQFGEALPAAGAATQDAPPPPPSSPLSRRLRGVSVSPGFALGPLHHVADRLAAAERSHIDDVCAEVSRFHAAVQQARDDIPIMLEKPATPLSEYDRKIFDAHQLFLSDPELISRTEDSISREHLNAEAAWSSVVIDAKAGYRGLQNPVLQSRADDLGDVGSRVLRHLQEASEAPDAEALQGVVAFETLRPSDVLALDAARVHGVCVAGGSQGSHAGILASALPMPVVFGLGEALAGIDEGTLVMVNGASATLTIEPDTNERQSLQRQDEAWQSRREAAESARLEPAITRDGQRVRVAANLASLKELEQVANSGADEIGLFRTEFLYMNRNSAPDEEEQLVVYRQILEALTGRALTIRTMDIGGDKPVPYLQRPSEANPNLGWRGIRHSLGNAELFEVQLLAMLRASAFGPVRIMFPLISTLDELLAAKVVVSRVQAKLRSSGVAFDEQCPVGIMIEVPAAAELADVLAEHVDFFSLGTNDLTQYVMAADRANPKVQPLFNPLQPAVIRAIKRSIDGAHARDIWVGMCGAMAGSELAAPLLLGLGLDEFSMNSTDIPLFKRCCADLDRSECELLAAEIVQLSSFTDVRERLEAFQRR